MLDWRVPIDSKMQVKPFKGREVNAACGEQVVAEVEEARLEGRVVAGGTTTGGGSSSRKCGSGRRLR
jgi:predicted alpha/beta-hydrolase family hydrolase